VRGSGGRFPDGLPMDLLRVELADNRQEPFAGADIAHAGDPNHPELPPDGPDPGATECNPCALIAAMRYVGRTAPISSVRLRGARSESSAASHAATDARVRADRQVALIAERGRPADGNRARPALWTAREGELSAVPAAHNRVFGLRRACIG
jgi:hypothetical protein